MLEDQILEDINATLEKLDQVATKLLNSMLWLTNLRAEVIQKSRILDDKKKTVGVI